ncbi:MAG TPA: hypothetical protein VF756_25045 [Thermoanaerobaculia bacterium]
MTRPRRFAVLALSLALIAPWGASAAGPKSEPGREAAAQALTGLWSWLTRLWAENGCLIDPDGCAGAQRDNGCILDPDGCATTQVDNGCILDPNGCASTQVDNGCVADPGGCANTQVDNGCIIDPNGGACR